MPFEKKAKLSETIKKLAHNVSDKEMHDLLKSMRCSGSVDERERKLHSVRLFLEDMGFTPSEIVLMAVINQVQGVMSHECEDNMDKIASLFENTAITFSTVLNKMLKPEAKEKLLKILEKKGLKFY